MKRILMTLIIALLALTPSLEARRTFATFDLVQSANGYIGSGLPAVATFGSAATTGNTIICGVWLSGQSGQPTLIDGLSNTYTKRIDSTAANVQPSEVFTSPNITGGTLVVTATPNGGDVAIRCQERTGNLTYVTGNGADHVGGSSVADSGAATLSVSGYGIGVMYFPTTTITAGNGWTLNSQGAQLGATTGIEEQTMTAGSYHALSGNSGTVWSIAEALFTASGGSPVYPAAIINAPIICCRLDQAMRLIGAR